jgi:hypothetical protein
MCKALPVHRVFFCAISLLGFHFLTAFSLFARGRPLSMPSCFVFFFLFTECRANILGRIRSYYTDIDVCSNTQLSFYLNLCLSGSFCRSTPSRMFLPCVVCCFCCEVDPVPVHIPPLSGRFINPVGVCALTCVQNASGVVRRLSGHRLLPLPP